MEADMGILDFLTGTKAAPAGVARKSAADLKAALLALNRDSSPWQVRDGAAEGCDLVAEWKIVDARWYEIFAKASLTKVFKVLMKLDEPKGEIRAVDQDWTVEWRAGVPNLSLSAEAFRGQKVEMSFGTAFAFKENLEFGKVYEYRFKTAEIKTPLQDTAAASGWGWRGVAFGKL
jgi:hypothetical protein